MLGRREKGRITFMTLVHIFKCLHWSRTSLSTGTAQRLLPDALSPILDRGADRFNKSPTKYDIHTRHSTFATSTVYYDATIYQSILVVEIKCTKPREINNTLMDVGGTRMNDYAYYECVDGFRLEGGSTTKRCNKDEEWEGEDPVCVGG